MKQFISFVIKEAKHIIRDKRTMLMLFGMPTAMMLLFGFAITNDVRNVRTIIVMSNADYAVYISRYPHPLLHHSHEKAHDYGCRH